MSLYRQSKNPFTPGELRMKTWRTLPGMDIAPDNELWAARCKQYWELQERLFGVKMSNFTMAADNIDGFVSTYSTCLEVLPGERTTDYGRLPRSAAGVASLRQ